MRGSAPNRGIVRQSVDLWPCYSAPVPSSLRVSVTRPSNTCEWVTLDGSKGCSQARLFVDSAGEIALAHGVPVRIAQGVGSFQIAPDESDKTSVASLVWSDTPVEFEAPFARVVTATLLPDPGTYTAILGPLAVQCPRDTSLTVFFRSTNAAGNLQWSELADTGTSIFVTATTLIAATGFVQLVTIAVPKPCTTIVLAPDVAAGNTQVRVVSGVVQ